MSAHVQPTTDTTQGGNPPQNRQVIGMLHAVIDHYHQERDLISSTYTTVIRQLNRIAGKNWSYRYIYYILAGNITDDARRAITTLHRRLTRPRKSYPPYLRVSYPDTPAGHRLAKKHSKLTMHERRLALDFMTSPLDDLHDSDDLDQSDEVTP